MGDAVEESEAVTESLADGEALLDAAGDCIGQEKAGKKMNVRRRGAVRRLYGVAQLRRKPM